MKTLVIVCISVLLCNCAAKIIPLKGDYPQTPIVTSTTNSFENVWDKLIDLFAQSGFSIKIIDRSSGLIISNGLLETTYENKEGKVADSTAFVAVPSSKDHGNNRITPISGYSLHPKTGKVIADDVFGEWNVRIKKTATGCDINVNLVNLYYETLISKITTKTTLLNFKSTGVFEKKVADLIK